MNENISEEQRQKNFEKWFGNSKVTENGEPLVVYHGTLSDFHTFDLKLGNRDNFLSKGFYFSTSINDINKNYGHLEGPDYKSRLENTIEKIRNDLDSENYMRKEDGEEEIEYTDDEIRLKALEEIKTEHDGMIIPAYLSLQNPFDYNNTKWTHSFIPEAKDTLKEAINFLESDDFVVSLKAQDFSLEQYEIEALGRYLKEFCSYEVREESTVYWNEFSTYLQENFCIDEDVAEWIAEQLTEQFDENVIAEFEPAETTVTRLIEVFEDAISNHSWSDVEKFKEIVYNFLEKYGESFEEFSFPAGELLEHLKNKTTEFYDPSEEDESIQELFVKHLQNEGYDGFVMDAHKEFAAMKVDFGTKHYICWDPTKIKSAIGNNGQYSPEEANILYRVAKKVNLKHPEMPLQEVKETILEFSAKMDNFLKFRVFDTVKEAQDSNYLPQDAKNDTKGFFYEANNKGSNFIGIIRKNIESKQDLLITYVHEAVGHSSVKNILGEKYKPTMIKLFDYYNRAHKKNFNPDRDKFFTTEQKIQKAEEFLAVSIERKFNSGFSGVKILVGAALNKVRKFFPEIPLTSFDTEYIENAAFEHFKKNELKDINIAQTVSEEIKGRNLVLNVPRKKNLNSGNGSRTQPT